MPNMPGNIGRTRKRAAAKRSAAEADSRRESAAKRGYGHKWRTKTRVWVLRRDPVCVIGGCNEAASEVDHIIPRRMGGPDTPENLQGLCGHHHKVKTAAESSFNKQHDVQRYVVCGAHGSGKSTHVMNEARPGDLVFDWDHIAAVMFGRDMYHTTKADTAVMVHMRDALIGWLQLNAETADVYIIISDYETAEATARKISATLVVIDPGQDQCINQIMNDPVRHRVATDQIRKANIWHSERLTNGNKTGVSGPETGVSDV